LKVIGITGGIGSGKSLVSKILKDKYGAFIIDTDSITKNQMEVGGLSYQGVVDFFGKGILTEDGSIDRGRLAEIVFKDRDKLLKLNKLTHPNTLEAAKAEIISHKNAGDVPYLIIETALMIESGFDSICDDVWYVYTPEEIRRDRLKKERNYADEKIDAIFKSQSRVETFKTRFSKVIENAGDIKKLEREVEQMMDVKTGSGN
jgi:dephospho-CoA kinase